MVIPSSAKRLLCIATCDAVFQYFPELGATPVPWYIFSWSVFFWSDISRFTVPPLPPTSSQSNVFLSKLKVTLPESSDDPLSICPGVMLAFPFASNCTSMSFAIAFGGVVSKTFTVLFTCVPLLPEASSTS